MKEEYYTGIPQIDAEHKRLFEIAESAYELRRNEFIPDKYDNIRDLLEELREYTMNTLNMKRNIWKASSIKRCSRRRSSIRHLSTN